MSERDDGFRRHTATSHEVIVGCIGIAIEAGFTRRSLASAIAPIFDGEDIRRRIVQKLVNVNASRDVPCVPMESQESEFRAFCRNPPRMYLEAVGC